MLSHSALWMLNSCICQHIWLNISKLIHSQTKLMVSSYPIPKLAHLQSSLSKRHLYLNSVSVHKHRCHDWVFSPHIWFPIHKQTLSDSSLKYFKSKHSSRSMMLSLSPSYWFPTWFCFACPALNLSPSSSQNDLFKTDHATPEHRVLQ